ncbi:hypothetical protein KR093_010581 [Drosophila rubida]|uniref:Protein peste n=1 Tax=Drosophila rubida TaxID=30044 RepID=A0AAD4K8Z2_9MUSC|nr:hypothetical protein KR093_010581 [Drosophila rubida]
MIGKSRIVMTSLLGAVLATVGLVYLINMEQLQRKTMEWLMVLKPNTMLTNLWQHPSLPMTAYVYIFNWTNSEEVNNPLVKPRFEEIGPYTFTESIQKLNVTWNPENSTVSYLRKSRFTFVPELSKGNLSDVMVTPNTLTVGITHKAQRWNPMLRSLMLIALNMYGNDATFERTAAEWLFDGFDTPLIKMSSILPSQLLPQMHFPYERIGYGYPRNHSTEVYGHHNIYTGADDFSKIGQIARWRYDDVAASFPHCKLKGSIGEFHRIPLRKGEPISYFLPDICRELQVDYAGTTIFEGMEAYVYKGSRRNMANGTENPDNSCYCQDSCQEVPSGVLNVSSCWYDVPVFASYPHFYNADPSYVDAVDGLKPDRERHEMVIILEPRTGMLLDIKATVMISLLVEPRPESAFRNARRNFLPLVWADYRVNISSDLLFYLKLLPISTIVGKICGILVVILGLTLMFYYPRKILMQRHFMRQIDITSLENRIQATTAASPELKNYGAEGSPLLVGLQYVAASVEAECAS